MNVFDELADNERTAIVSQCDRVTSETCLCTVSVFTDLDVDKTHELINQRDQCKEVFFDREVKGVSILEVDRNFP